MFPLVKLVFLLSILSGTANAQWGTVVAQSDTNRFITSQEKFGLIMPHQEVIVGLLDTTITSVGTGGGNAYKVIVGSLLDYEDNCVNYSIVNGVASCEGSYELWREMEKSTGWYQAARGDTTAMFPTNYAVTISTGQDSVNIWNRDTAELWMAFKVASGNHIFTGTQNEIEFKDGKLYSASTGGLFVEDFLTERASIYNVGGFAIYEGGFQSRNKGGTGLFLTYSTAIALAASSTNSVAVTRDPFGLKDELGRPDHWWIVSSPSNGGGSLYNPHTNTIYDQGATSGDFNIFSVSDRGQIWGAYNNSGGYDKLSMMGNAGNNTIFGQAGDGFTPQVNYAGDSAKGEEKLAWTTGINGTKILASNNRNSIVGDNADNAYAWCDEGAYILSPSGGFGAQPTTNFAKQRWSSTVNAPVEFGDAVLTLALEDNTTGSSPYGNTMTAVNSPGTVTAVFGKGYSSTTGSYLHSKTQAEYNIGTGDFYVSIWFKSEDATNRGANKYLWSLTDNGASAGMYAYLFVETDGSLAFHISDDASGVDDIDIAPDVFDAEWHNVIVVRDESALIYTMYLDGVNVGTAAISAAAASMATDEFYVADLYNGSTNFYWEGLIDDVSFGVSALVSAEAAAKIHAEGRKKLGMGTPVFTSTPDDALLSNNVVEVDALDDGMWAVAFSDANTVQVFDGRIPIQEIAAPAGTVKSVALIQSPGTDSVGVAIGTTTNLKFVQPAVNLRAAMAHRYQEPIFVGQTVMVDSAGIDGIFWTGNDGIDAGFNAGRTFIKIARGTYTPFDVDHPGMIIEGSGWSNVVSATDHTYGGTIIDGTGIGDAIDVAGGPHSIVRDLAVFSEGGAGNAYAGIHVTSSYVTIDNIIAIDSDHYPVFLESNYATVTNSRFYDADGWSVASNGSCCNTVIGNHFVNCGNAIYFSTNSDDNIAVGNHQKDCGLLFQVDSGSNYNIFVANRYEGGYTNNGTGTVIVGNEGTAH